MNFKAFYDKIVDLIYGNRRNIMRVSFSALALLLLIIVLFFSSDNFNINSEVDTLIKYIDGRQYTMAETYFDDIEKEFSDSKMGLINTVNALNTISVDASNLVDLGKRVDEMYKEENITYESATSYLQITSSLKGVNQGLDEYKQHIKTLYESRQIYKDATKNQSIKKYHEAIELYDKVLKEDDKYYSLAQNAKKECIEVMHDYYISQAKSLAEEGKYEEALKNLSYLNPYYDDDNISELEEEYNKFISNYTMTSDDIINMITRRSDEKKEDLSVVLSYLQIIDGKRYYYGDVSKNEKIINEVLIDTETKKMYSYKSDKKDYNCDYSDAYFKIDENSGETIFSIDKEQAKDILESKFEEENKKYKSIELLENKKIEKYNNDDLKNMINKNGNVYYYFSVKIGWFRAKETYVINMYDRTLYQLVNDEVQSF